VRGAECNQVTAWVKKEKKDMIGIHHPKQT
jgi:hypothetical protein